jgi:hypothetical protein
MNSGRPPGAIEPVSLIYKLNNGLITRSLDGLSDADIWRVTPGGGNPIGWLLGHLTESRVGLLMALAHPMETGWGKLFGRGSVLADPSAYPTRDAIEGVWRATHGRMRDAFAALTDERLASPSTIDVPGAKTLGDQIAFVAFHEAYHVGQIGYARKQLGRSTIAG